MKKYLLGILKEHGLELINYECRKNGTDHHNYEINYNNINGNKKHWFGTVDSYSTDSDSSFSKAGSIENFRKHVKLNKYSIA